MGVAHSPSASQEGSSRVLRCCIQLSPAVYSGHANLPHRPSPLGLHCSSYGDSVKHHFADMLDRDGDYWTIIPNRERYAYVIGDVPPGSKEVTIVTIGKNDEHWQRALTLPNLDELTLHEPTNEQLKAIAVLRSVKRLRITHAHPKTLDFIQAMGAVEELVLEYVSGFTDLSPLRALKHLRALHLENLRRVSDFGGLAGVESLRYLAVYGTLDWKQPIADFEFLRGLPSLEVLGMFQVITKRPYPALLPALDLENLKMLHVSGSEFVTEEYALLEEGLPGVQGANWGPFRTWTYAYLDLPANDIRARLPAEVIRAKHPEVLISYDGRRRVEDPASRWFEATGKGAGRVKCHSPAAEAKCREYVERYAAMKAAARTLIDRIRRHTSRPC